jgi:DNA-binding transcriptional MerR regulator
MTDQKKGRSDPRLYISELADQLGISPRTIRFYEEKGMISPRRTSGNQRIYSARDRSRLRMILRGKRFGFSLSEIAEMIGLADSDYTEADQLHRCLVFGEKRLAEVRQRKEELALLEQDLLSALQRIRSRMEEIGEKK